MRTQIIKLFFPLALMILCAVGHAQQAAEQSYPDEFALITGSDGRLAYVKFPEGLALYVFDGDEPGKSNCTGGCAAAWPPVLAKDGARPIGDWTPVSRDDGSKQWAYKNKPVYVFFHDVAGNPMGVGQKGWSLLEL